MVRPARRPAPFRPPENLCEGSVRHQPFRQPVVDPDPQQIAAGSLCRRPGPRVRCRVHCIARIIQRSVMPEERARLVDLVAGRVPQKRLKHMLRVETLAVRLARFWGVSEEKASVASLLHDIARDEPESLLLELVKETDDPLIREMAETFPGSPACPGRGIDRPTRLWC